MGKNKILTGSLAILILFLIVNATYGSLVADVLEFNVEKGAKKSYSFIQYLNEDALEDELEFNNENGVQQNVTITQGVTITIEITDAANDEVDYQLTIDGIRSKEYKEEHAIYFHLKELHVTFLRQTTVNRSYWDTEAQEFEDQFEFFKSQFENASVYADYNTEINGDLLIFELNIEGEYNSTPVWNELKTSFNWKTGWLNYHYINYSVLHEGRSLIEIKAKSEGLFGLTIPGYEVNLIGLSFSVFMIGIYKKRK